MDSDFMPWFTAFWEGEGNLHVKAYLREGGRLNRVVALRVDQSTSRGRTAEEAMYYIKNQIGFGTVSPRIQEKNYAPRFFWSCKDRAKVITLLRQMLPYLHVRKEEVQKKLATLEEWNKTGFHRWADEEKEYLQSHLEMSLSELAKHFGVSKASVKWQRLQLGMNLYPWKFWTKEELEMLEANINLSPLNLMPLLPERSYEAIRIKRWKLRRN